MGGDSDRIHLGDIIIPSTQRRLRPWKVAHIAAKMRTQGYNESYPITLQTDRCTLVDGGHRVEAARQADIDAIPYVIVDTDPIAHSIRANRDGTDTEVHDVFDLAELCWQLKDIHTQEEIAAKTGLSNNTRVSHYRSIKEKLHGRAWDLACADFKRIREILNQEWGSDLNPDFKILKPDWAVSHLSEIVSVLFAEDNATYRAQLYVIRACIIRVNEKDKRFGQVKKQVTAKWIKGIVQEHAWYIKLARHMRDNLVARVPIRDRVDLLRSIYAGVYGVKDDEALFDKFDATVKRLNEKVLGIILYCDDAFQCIPTLEDKSIALVVTDPPYNVTDKDWDCIGTDDEYIDFTSRWLNALRPKMADDYHLFFFCDPDYAARIETEVLSGWPLQSRIIWSNRSLPSGRQPKECFVRTWQMIFHVGTHDLNWPQKWTDGRFDVLVFAAPNANTKDGGYHPTPKPQALIEHLVKLGSKPTDLVVDPFAGGGTTGAACTEIRQRRCVLVEKEDKFCRAIEKRLQIRREE